MWVPLGVGLIVECWKRKLGIGVGASWPGAQHVDFTWKSAFLSNMSILHLPTVNQKEEKNVNFIYQEHFAQAVARDLACLSYLAS